MTVEAALEALRSAAPYLAGTAAALAAYLLAQALSSRRALRGVAGRLSRVAGPEAPPPEEARPGSEAWQVRLAFRRLGLEVAGRERAAVWAARLTLAAALAAAIPALGFPPLMALAGPPLAWALVKSFLEGARSSFRRRMEAEIPTFLSRMAATVQVTPGVLQALAEVAATLNPEGPLAPWVERLAAHLQARGRPGLQQMLEEAEAISPSLALAVFEIGRLWETGGVGYSRAFARAAENLSGILDARAAADARAAGMRSAIRVVLASLVVVTAVMLRNPTVGPVTRSPLVQGLYLLLAVWVAVGWTQIQDMVEEAVG